MRKWNTILSVLMLLIFMIHGIMGSFMLNGVGSSAGKLLAWIGVGILVVHTVIGVILTVQSLQTAKQSGKMYLKQNAIFWARRASKIALDERSGIVFGFARRLRTECHALRSQAGAAKG